VSEAPKILWYDDQDCSAGPVQFGDGEVKYVRADLVDGLINEEQLEALMRWVSAEIDVRIELASDRDSLHEAIAECECKKDLYVAFGLRKAEIGRGME
jgi:hypothetical protein